MPSIDWMKWMNEWEDIVRTFSPLSTFLFYQDKLEVVFCTHTHTNTLRSWKLFTVFRWGNECVHENGTPDVDKLIYGLIYLCGLVTFCLPHPEYNDIVPTNVQRPFSWLSSLILPHLSRLLSVDAHTSSSYGQIEIVLRMHQSCWRGGCAIPQCLTHIRIIRFSNWIK